jgi:hypothetical protein
MHAYRRAVPSARLTIALLLGLGLVLLLPATLPAGALAASGSLSWRFAAGSPAHTLDAITVAACGPNGSLYAGFDWGDDWADGADLGMYRLRPRLVAHDPVIWARTYDGPDHQADFPVAVTVDHAGAVIAGGQTHSAAGGADWLVVKWRPGGARAWTAVFGSNLHLNDFFSDVGCDLAGNVYACGMTDFTGGRREWIVIKFRASDGKRLWDHYYTGPEGSALDNWPKAIAVPRSGGCYVTGFSDDAGGDPDLLVMKLRSDGAYSWIHRVDGAAHGPDYGEDIVLRGGKVYVAGETTTSGGGTGLLMARYASTGRRSWLHTWQSAAGAGTSVRGLAVDGAGGTVAAGVVYSGTPSPKAFLASYATSGKYRWAHTSWDDAVGGPEAFNAVAVDDAGHIWVAGSIGKSGSTQDALLARYRPSGGRLWARRLDGAAHKDDWFNVVTLWGSGSVFAGGVVGTTAGNDDVLAAKYVK